MIVKNGLCTQKYTIIGCEEKEEQKFNAPHHFEVANAETLEVVGRVNFQEGPIKENGINGVCNEDLILMVLTRLESFQQTEFRCRENACAITKLEEALMWLRKRTLDREARGVEGTHTV
ncbi:Acb2/Tad1 domain-containing protein [Clostridium cagae]|uniref:Acb2/Tad1 domain-containing protein n=1 Tax=Clostridium cagae TaxID=2080751 RepID=UPI003F76016F